MLCAPFSSGRKPGLNRGPLRPVPQAIARRRRRRSPSLAQGKVPARLEWLLSPAQRWRHRLWLHRAQWRYRLSPCPHLLSLRPQPLPRVRFRRLLLRLLLRASLSRRRLRRPLGHLRLPGHLPLHLQLSRRRLPPSSQFGHSSRAPAEQSFRDPLRGGLCLSHARPRRLLPRRRLQPRLLPDRLLRAHLLRRQAKALRTWPQPRRVPP